MSTWRFLAQRAITLEWLHTDLPITRDSGPSWELSGVGQLSFAVEPERIGGLVADDGRDLFEEWGTLVYAEQDGLIRWGGIVVDSTFSGQSLKVEVASFATYPHGIPLEDIEFSGIDRPAALMVWSIWALVQAPPDSDLGVTVNQSDALDSPVLLGTADDPYELFWWDAPDAGQEIDNLLDEGGMVYTEHHAWNEDKTDVTHEIRLHYPRAGLRRRDLTFRAGENVIGLADAVREGDEFANSVLGIGAGEGKGSLRRSTAVRDGRLRRTHVHLAKDVASRSRMDSQIKKELTARRKPLTISSVTVRDHPHAPMASWSLGDDVLIEAELPHLGKVSIWHRVMAWSLNADDTATLSLERTDIFTV